MTRSATRPSRALIPLLLLPCLACIMPPAVLPAGISRQELVDFPPGSERVMVHAGDGAMLRGVFVPAGDEAPVVLHLLPSACSITYGTRPHQFCHEQFGEPSVWDLHQLGCASLVLDYQGVGVSGGERSPRTLQADARAAYAEAVRRAGGREDRVVVRGTSIGSLAAATLIEAGAAPAAWILFAPIRAETVASNYLYHEYWDPVSFLLSPLLRAPVNVSLEGQLRRVKCPLRVFAPFGSSDELLTAAESAMLERVTRAVGGQWFRLSFSHVVCAAAAKYLRPEERTLLHQLFGARIQGPARDAAVAADLPEHLPELRDDPRLQARLEMLTSCLPPVPPALMAAAVQSRVPMPVLLPWLGWVVRNHAGPLLEVPQQAWTRLLDLDDRDGSLPAAAIREVAPWITGRAFSGDPEGIEAFVWNLAGMQSISGVLADPFAEAQAAGDAILSFLLLRGYGTIRADEADPARAHQRLLRVALKAAAIPDRVVVAPDGSTRLEIWQADGWRPLGTQRSLQTPMPHAVLLEAFRHVRMSILYDAEPPGWDASIPTRLRLRLLRASGPASAEPAEDASGAARSEQLIREGPLELAEAPGLVAAMVRSSWSVAELLRWYRELPDSRRHGLASVPASVADTLWEPGPVEQRRSNHALLRNALWGYGLFLGQSSVLRLLRDQWFPRRLSKAELDDLISLEILEREYREDPRLPTEAAVQSLLVCTTLRAIGIPARLTAAGECVESWQDGVWRLVPLGPLGP